MAHNNAQCNKRINCTLNMTVVPLSWCQKHYLLRNSYVCSFTVAEGNKKIGKKRGVDLFSLNSKPYLNAYSMNQRFVAIISFKCPAIKQNSVLHH